MNSNVDKRVVLGSDKPSEVVATALRYPSQPGSFSPGNYGGEVGLPDGQPDSPIKTSPVSERIKALEALAAKKKEPDFRNDGGFSHFRDRHIEKAPVPEKITPADKVLPAPQKKRGSVNSESPESPFEVLGDFGQVNEFENTADWMRAHLPPAPGFDDAVALRKGDQASGNLVMRKEVKEAAIVIPGVPAAFTSVPDSFPEAAFKDSKSINKIEDSPKQPRAEEDSEFDLRFLPTAYMWEKENQSTQDPINPAPISPPSPAPPTGFESTPPLISAITDTKPKDLGVAKNPYDGDMAPTEAPEVDSSGESDETVIEDGAAHPTTSESASCVPVPSNDPNPNLVSSDPSLPDEEQEKTPLRIERKLMQVPTINVIETDEPNYSDEEMEMEMEIEEEEDQSDDVVEDPAQDAPRTPELPPELPETNPELANMRPLETEFMEGYSPPSSPMESDIEYSPTHILTASEPDPGRQESTIKMHVLQNTSVDFPQTQPEKSQVRSSDNTNNNFSSFKTDEYFSKEDIELSDNYDEWSDDVHIKPDKTTDRTAQALSDVLNITDRKMDTDAKQGQIEALPPCNPSFMQDDLYERQSFDDDYDALPSLDDTPDQNDFGNDQVSSSSDTSQIHVEILCANATEFMAPKDVINSEAVCVLDEEPLPKPVGGQPSPREYPKDPYSSFGEPPTNKEPVGDLKATSDTITATLKNIDSIPREDPGSEVHMDTDDGPRTPDTTSDPESIEPDCSVSRATDSFVDFMKECLKSRQDPGPEDVTAVDEQPGNEEHALQPPASMAMDLEKEELTICALKELASSQEGEDEEVEKTILKPYVVGKPSPGSTGVQQSPRIATSAPPSTQAGPASDCTYYKEVEAIDEWVAEAYYLAEHVLTTILTHLSVKDLIHWRDPKKSGVVFGVSMLVLLSLAAFSVISVVSYLLLALLCVTITFRIYKSVVQAVQKSGDGHPFKCMMEKDVSIPPETFRKYVDASLAYINCALKQMSRLFLVEDLVDSLKLAVGMWLLTYVGAVFNGITILILADILLFAVPPIYEKNKTQIDQYIDVARTQINSTMAKLQEKLPGSMKRTKAE
ncbi:hypothetical protein NHX12_013863 [Muraenolepis orangiensis]|uniref:Reticulon n=1 Tax=Muraenolepis orangiensis TaxID=630683 RepID=A0A9Q0DB65_9TELE|nr:hypothetical protein NHX12_013863 [Muraenolepis orangiensis]